MPSVIDTPSYRHADLYFQGTLTRRLRSWSRMGRSAESMARELYRLSDGDVDLTGQTVRLWLKQLGLHPLEDVG